MDLNYLKKLIKIFDDSTATELKIDEEGLKLKLSKNNSGASYIAQPVINQPIPNIAVNETVSAPVQAENTENANAPVEETHTGHIIKSPIVGTYYSAPSPDSEPYVKVGDHVSKGATLCIVEAMKLMNEIESDVSGTVTKMLVENAQPVDYGQHIFVIKPD